MVTTRWLEPVGLALLKTAYVNADATLPRVQGRGHGSAVMRQLASIIDADYAIACLETERWEFYEKLGWERWRGPLAERSKDGLIPTSEEARIMILQLSQTPPLNLDAMLTIECQRNRTW